MGWRSTVGREFSVRGCDEWNDIYCAEDDYPEMMAAYEYVCPGTGEIVRFLSRPAGEIVGLQPDGCVEVRRVP